MNLKSLMGKFKAFTQLKRSSQFWALIGFLFLLFGVASFFVGISDGQGVISFVITIGLGLSVSIFMFYGSLKGPWTGLPREISTTIRSVEERKAILAKGIVMQVANGWRLDVQTDFEAVLSSGKKVNHILHLLLSIVTVGMWILPWILMAMGNRIRRQTISVDEFGNTRFI